MHCTLHPRPHMRGVTGQLRVIMASQLAAVLREGTAVPASLAPRISIVSRASGPVRVLGRCDRLGEWWRCWCWFARELASSWQRGWVVSGRPIQGMRAGKEGAAECETAVRLS